MRATKIPLKNDNLPNNQNIVKYDNIYFKMHISKLTAIKLRKRQLFDIKKKKFSIKCFQIYFLS